MKKLNKYDWIYIVLSIILIVSVTIYLTKDGYIYGSTTDWTDQHYNIPDYFRNLFYQTKQLVPSYAFNIGAGENIFYLSYYGLLSPIILFSYFLPMVSMSNYIIFTSILGIIISNILLYLLLRRKHNTYISVLSTVLFVCSAPLIFHTHRHIMFVNYMPFLIMGFYGVEHYFNHRKSWMLILSVFLIIMTSYYYSVGSIICLILYGIYRYISITQKITFKKFMIDGCRYIANFLVAMMMAMILILPTVYAIISGRTSTSTNQNYYNLIIPGFNYLFVLYNNYGAGLTSVFIFSIFEKIKNKSKALKVAGYFFLSIIIFPIIIYIMNGFMYVDSKALIPLIPLAIIMIADTFENLTNAKKTIKSAIIIYGVIVLILSSIFYQQNQLIYMIDFLITLIVLLIYFYTNKKFTLTFLLIAPLLLMINVNKSDELITKEDFSKQAIDMNQYLVTDESYRANNNYYALNNVNNIYNSSFYTTTIYSSINNKYYKDFYFNTSGNEIRYRNNAIISPVNNIYFNILMGNKYIISRSQMVGYEPIKEYENFSLYENNYTYPIGYAIHQTISQEKYDELEYPYSVEALLKYVILEKSEDDYKTDIEPITLDYDVEPFFDYRDGIYYIDIEQDKKIYDIKLNNSDDNKILIISFDNEYQETCAIGDTYIIINGIKNKLTCSSWIYQNNNYSFNYTIPYADKLEIEFAKGHYKLSNLKIYEVSIQSLQDLQKNIDKFIIDGGLTRGDNIVGDIDVTQSGYFILTVPYDEGYHIKVDGVETEYQLTNNYFIGFKIEEGTHHIEIKYIAKGLKLSKIISLLGLICFIFIIIKERKNGEV